jgi:hypothetical protein
MTWRRIALYWACFLGLSAYYVLVERPAAVRKAALVARAPFLNVALDEISAVEIRRGDRVVRARRVGDRWELVEPAGRSVPPDLIGALINNLLQLPDVEVVADASTELAPFGLDVPVSQITLATVRGEPMVVKLGNRNPAGTAVYATRSGSEHVYLIGLNVRYYEDLLFEALGAAPSASEPEGR